MSVAAAAFGEREGVLARGDGAATQSLGGIDSSLAWFLGAIVVSRAGLYGFDVGAMSLQQQLVDERDRAAVGATQEALCNAGDLGIFALTALGAADPVNFSRLVALATASVIVSAVLYAAWMRLFHAHPHHHDAENGDGAPGGGAHDHAHEHGSSGARALHSHHHAHILQHEGAVKRGGGIHTHVHYAGPSWLPRLFGFAEPAPSASAGAHDHSSHEHQHGHGHAHDRE